MFTFISRHFNKDRETIELATAFDEKKAHIIQVETSSLEEKTDGRMSAHSNFSRMLHLRTEMATAAEIKKLLNKGRIAISLGKDETLESRLLGTQATQFNIYKRDMAQDRSLVMKS